MAFEIHPRLAAGGFYVGKIGISHLLLKNNALFPWFILIPECEGIADLHQLSDVDYHDVMKSVRQVSEFISTRFQPEKLNIGCIGNQVRQLHVQLIGRSTGDPAWPGTVWAFPEKSEYAPEHVEEILMAARRHLVMKCD